MRGVIRALTLPLLVLAVTCGFLLVTMATPSTPESKIHPELLAAIRADVNVEADIMVQLESPEEVMHRVCGGEGGADPGTLSRAQKTTCMVDNLQHFAEQSQRPVKELLDARTGEYTHSSFFWINNSVSVKKAKGGLVLDLARLETVKEIRVEEIFQLLDGQGKPTSEGKTVPHGKISIGFGMFDGNDA